MQAGLVARVRRAIREHGLLAPGERGLVAVSGGPDSVALLGLLAALAGKLRVALAVGHVDHGLRGAESRGDALFCEGLCRLLGVPFVLRRAVLDPGASSLEARAREARVLCPTRPADFVQALVVPPMPCGTGACRACWVELGERRQLACVDGPVFSL